QRKGSRDVERRAEGPKAEGQTDDLQPAGVILKHAHRNFLLAIPCLAVLPRPALADRVGLETGEVFTGKILRHNEEEVSIRLETGGVLSFKWSSIRKAKKGSEVLARKAEPARPAERIPVKR